MSRRPPGVAAEAAGIPLLELPAAGPEDGSLAGEPLTDPVERADDDLAVILYTSGPPVSPRARC